MLNKGNRKAEHTQGIYKASFIKHTQGIYTASFF